MLMSLWEKHNCKLFSSVDTACNLKPVRIKWFRCQVNQSTNDISSSFSGHDNKKKNVKKPITMSKPAHGNSPVIQIVAV